MKIIPPKNLFYRFGFGHFKGVTLVEMYTGGSPLPAVLNKYLIELNLNKTNFEEDKYNVLTDGRYISMFFLENYRTINQYKDFGLDESDKIELDSLLIKQKIDGELLLEKFIIKVFDNLFGESPLTIKSGIINLNNIVFADKATGETTKFNITERFNLFTCNGSPGYLEWCINNVANFFVSPTTLEAFMNMDVKEFSGVKLEKLSDGVFKIIPHQKIYRHSFLKKTVDENSNKYAHFQALVEQKREDVLDEENFGWSDQDKPYTDQQYIDDAFGGDASAYWNID